MKRLAISVGAATLLLWLLVTAGQYLASMAGAEALFKGFVALVCVGCIAAAIYICPYWKGGPLG